MQWVKSRYRLLLDAIHYNSPIDREVVEQAVAVSIVRILWTAPIVSFGHILAAFVFWLQEPSSIPAEVTWRKWVIGTNIAMAMINSIIALGAWLIRRKKRGRQIQTLFLYTVITYVLAAGLVISIIDQLVISSISPLIISVAIVGTFYYVPPKNSFFVFAVFFLCFHFAFSVYENTTGNILSSILANGLVAIIAGFSLSFVNWQHFHKLKLQQKTIARQQELLEQMAYQDSLTELPNRRWLDELMKTEVASVQRKQAESCLVVLDIDNFKQINDDYGHPAGDTLLSDFARFLKDNIGGSNTLVRIGGEEFVILARNTSVEQCAALAERIRTKIAEHVFSVDHHKIQITVSFGVANLLGVECTKNYYSDADQALYLAKQAGRNRVVVYERPR